MVSRRARNYKEKGHFGTFGQFMLPLAVLMALALLFFSVKLFFFSSNDTKRTIDNTPAATSQTQQTTTGTKPAEPVTATQPQAQPTTLTTAPNTSPTAAPVARPVTTQPSTPPPSTVQPTTQQKPQTATPAAATRPAAPAASSTQQAANSGSRFDVQIGSFASKSNAEALAQKAKGQGHDVYLSETTSNGKPFYRVRVKGSTTRETSQALAQKLESQGYPTMIVPPGK